MPQNIIQRFSKSFKKYMLSYKQGFYIIPYLANSPEATIESFKNTPFVKWDETKNLLTQNSPFMDGLLYYYKIEEGLWLFLSQINYKANIEYKMYFDDSLPCDYYLFSYNLIKHSSKNKVALINGLSYNTFSWNLFKPKSNLSLANFKDTHNSSVGIFAKKEWINEKLSSYPGFKNSCLEGFLNSTYSSSIWPELEINIIYQEILIQFSKKENTKNELSKYADMIIQYLIKNYTIQHNQSNTKIDSLNQTKLLKIEKTLNDHLLLKFPGIEELAKQAGMSPTKLKNEFKLYFGEPIYQYYLGKQMDYALILLRDKKMKVGSVAKLLGYQSEGKFTVAFKEKFGKLPSKVAAIED